MVFPNSSNPASFAPETIEATLLALRRKQGSWVDWAQGCQLLQKAGFNPQQIFEETGFEPIQQNQIMVAEQVYQSLVKAGVSPPTQAHFNQRGSDQLYELRVLSQADRASTAEFILQHGLDADQVQELVKPIKEYAYRKPNLPGFGDSPGDAIAFHYWNLARQKAELQDRSRLIAQGLRFADSASARQEIEKLLTDFTVVKAQPAPRLPLYRLETETELPRVIPVAGQMPLSLGDLKAVPVAVPAEPFGLVSFSGVGAWLAVPGWQVIFRAEDPVGLLTQAHQLPNYPTDGPDETVLVIVDRAERQWNPESYFLVANGEHLSLSWSATPPSAAILAEVVLILRPKQILDEDYNRELWQLDE
ncbi:MAG: hypothetical protein KGQ93_00940 [Cyanobacteria bacterium REEB459]|nr:hypothetical protein [Cyanobacteria bacterium REEB459]